MKKFLLLAVLSVTTFFTSCNNDDDSNSNKTKQELLVGTWKIKSSGSIVDGIEKADTLNTCELESNTTFEKDGNFTDIDHYSINKGGCEEDKYTGKWSLDNDNLILKIDDDDEDDNPTITIKNLTKEELKFVSSFPDGYKSYSVLTRVN